MERNYESEKKKRERDYLLDFEDMLTSSASMVKRWGSGEVLITLRYGDTEKVTLSHSIPNWDILLFLSFIVERYWFHNSRENLLTVPILSAFEENCDFKTCMIYIVLYVLLIPAISWKTFVQI